jgi:large subunit ribosomal protein L22
MADEKDKQPKTGDDKRKARSRSAAKPKEGTARAEPKSGAAKSSGRSRQKKADEAPKQGARKPAAKAKAAPKAASKTEPKGEAKTDPKAAAKAPARARGAAKQESKPAPAARRRSRSEPPARPVVRARAKYVRSSARKARLVMDHVRGKSVSDARALLRHSPRGIARDLDRLIASAVANAENNHDLVGDDLYVKEIYADEGPTLRRFRPRALGRATRIRKRTSHLTVALSTKE